MRDLALAVRELILSSEGLIAVVRGTSLARSARKSLVGRSFFGVFTIVCAFSVILGIF